MGFRARQAIFGFITDLGGNVVLTVVNVATVPVILRLTSDSLYGFWLTTLSVLGYLALTDLGLGMSLTRLVAGLSYEKDRQALDGLVSSAFLAFCMAGLFLLGVGLGIAPFIPGWLKIPAIEASNVIAAYKVAVLSASIALPLSIFGSVLVGFQRMALTNVLRNLISLIAIAISLGLLFTGLGIMALALSSLFGVIAGGLMNYAYVRRLWPNVRINLSSINLADLKRLMSFGGMFQLGRIANTVAVSSDNLVIGAAMGAAAVTPYTFTSKLAVFFSQGVASKLPIATFPTMSEMFAQNQVLTLQRTFILLTVYSIRLAAIAGVFVAITNYKFISLWVGSQYFGGNLLNIIFVYWIIQDTVYRGTTAMIYASGEMRNWVIATFAEAAINLILSILLVGPLGLAGVALGTSIGKTLTTGWFTPYLICRRLDLKIKVFLWQGIMRPTIRCLPGVGLTLWISLSLPTYWGWTWVILVGGVSVFTNMFFFEGSKLLKTSHLPWRYRVKNLMKIDIKEP